MEFLNQNVFYLMLVPLILMFLLVTFSKNSIEKYFSKDMIEILKVNSGFLSRRIRNMIFLIILFLFIVALARPVIDKKEQNVKQSLIPIVIALDVSTSMLAEDIYPNRISLAKKKLQQIIEVAENTTIGIVLFAKDAFILSPVTEDFISLKYIVDNLDTNLNFTNGSNIFSTLEATKHMLIDFKVKNMIILSDGGNDNEYKEELAFAKANDIILYSIGLATKDGAPMPKNGSYITNSNGDIVRVKLNESIKKLSLQSGGGYIDYTLDKDDVNAIINRINIQSKKEELNIQKIKVYTELFYYPLGLAIFLLLIALSSLPKLKKDNTLKNILYVCFFSLSIFAPITSNAYTFNFENIDNASKFYNKKDFKSASDYYKKVNTNNESLYNLGNSLYKEKKYKDAIETYSKISTTNKELEAKKLHNLGNSYVNTNDLKKAKEFYEESLKIKENKETKENLDIVNKELDKNKQENKNKDNNKRDQNEAKKDDSKKPKNEEQKEKNQNNQENKNEKQENQKDKNQQQSDKEKKAEQENQKDKNQQQSDKEKKAEQENQKKASVKEQKNKDDLSDMEEKKWLKKQKNKDDLSDMEEKKWLKMINNQQTSVYMRKVETNKESRNDEEQPW